MSTTQPKTEYRVSAALTIAWEAYTRSAAAAQVSGSIEDGIAAGRAWRHWLELFLDGKQGAVIPIRGRTPK